MGISTQVISQAAQTAVNLTLARSVAVANAALAAQQVVVGGTAELAKAALADNNTVTLSETRLSFNDQPASITVEPVRPGQLQVSPPQEGDVPRPTVFSTPAVRFLSDPANPTQLDPSAGVYVPGLEGDLVLPGGTVRLEDVSLGAVRVEASPRAPIFTAPVLSTSGSSESSQPGLEQATQAYVQVVLVGSAQAIVASATEGEPPSGP